MTDRAKIDFCKRLVESDIYQELIDDLHDECFTIIAASKPHETVKREAAYFQLMAIVDLNVRIRTIAAEDAHERRHKDTEKLMGGFASGRQ